MGQPSLRIRSLGEYEGWTLEAVLAEYPRVVEFIDYWTHENPRLVPRANMQLGAMMRQLRRHRFEGDPMAMGQEARRKAVSAFDNHRKWELSTGSLKGVPGTGDDLGWLSSESNAAELKASLREAVYVVYSYNTPIGWALEDEETGLLERVIPAASHSNTTGAHQGVLREAWESFHDGTAKGRKAWLKQRGQDPDEPGPDAMTMAPKDPGFISQRERSGRS